MGRAPSPPPPRTTSLAKISVSRPVAGAPCRARLETFEHRLGRDLAGRPRVAGLLDCLCRLLSRSAGLRMADIPASVEHPARRFRGAAAQACQQRDIVRL